jgi:hypothetical protein
VLIVALIDAGLPVGTLLNQVAVYGFIDNDFFAKNISAKLPSLDRQRIDPPRLDRSFSFLKIEGPKIF